MYTNDKGWPLGQAAIQARYDELIKNDTELPARKIIIESETDSLARGHGLQTPNFYRSSSTREGFSRVRSHRRVFRRTGLVQSSRKGSWSDPISSPSSSDRNAEVPPLLHLLRLKAGDSSLSEQDVLSSVNMPRSRELAMSLADSSGSRSFGVITEFAGTKNRRPMFLAKQFKIISNCTNSIPRRNIKILGQETSEARFAACGAKVVSVTKEIEKDQLNYQVPEHHLSSGEAPLTYITEYSTPQFSSNVRLDSLSRTPSLSRRSGSSLEQYSSSYESSPRSVISEMSILETVMSSTDNEICHRSEIPSRISNSSWEERTSGGFDSFGHQGELDIAGLSFTDCKNAIGYPTCPQVTSTRICTTSRPKYKQDPTNNADDISSNVHIYEKMNSGRSSFGSFHNPSGCNSMQCSVRDHDYKGCMGHQGVIRRNREPNASTSSLVAPRYSALQKPRRELSPRSYRNSSKMLAVNSDMIQKGQGIHIRSDKCKKGWSTRRPHRGLDYHSSSSSKVKVAIGKRPSRKSLRIAGLHSGMLPAHTSTTRDGNLEAAMPLNSISPQEAVAVFQDEIARMMLEEGESDDIADIEDFLDGYMRLSSIFYLEIVEDFFRDVCYDCYKRPLGVGPPKILKSLTSELRRI